MSQHKSQIQTVADSGKMPVAERFVSINGEGVASGKLAAFIRFAGCNLRCSYCDSAWANSTEAIEVAEKCSILQLVSWVQSTGVKCLTITGGEPALQPLLPELLKALGKEFKSALRIEIETNGAVDLTHLVALRQSLGTDANIVLTVDWKLSSSNMQEHMQKNNFKKLGEQDTVKFVCGTTADLKEVLKVAHELNLKGRVNVYLSVVFGKLKPEKVVEFMKRNNMGWATFQLQIHKIVWPNVTKGV